MKKWWFAWFVFTVYVVSNMAMLLTAEQPHLIATFMLGFFFYLIFGLRGVFGAMWAVTAIVLLALCVHEFQTPALNLPHFYLVLLHLLLDLITLSGGGGLAYWLLRLRKCAK